MPKETMADEYMNSVLDHLTMIKDDTLNTSSTKFNSYADLKNLLEKEELISGKQLNRLLTICVSDLKSNTTHAAIVLSVVLTVLRKIKSGKYTDLPLPELLSSALAIINILKTIPEMHSRNAPLLLCFEVLLSYPDNTLVALATSHTSDLLAMIDACTLQDKQKNNIDVPLFKLIIKLLQILPNETKQDLVKKELRIWFSRIIPRAILLTNNCTIDMNIGIEMLELLTDSLVHIDYAEDPQWNSLLECIYNPVKYPAIMKNLLESKNDIWYRLWIIFIRLLKNQVTKVNNSPGGSPINSMLPVVELAFKLDSKSRCQAFQCWNVLIDNFASELNETPAHVHKRMKLLIVPLKSSNAKVEEIALAKLNTWWHLMRKFHSRMDTFTDMILIPFLHFCFGKLHTSGRVIFSPGQFSDDMKKQCLQAFVEIAGHVDCNGCVTLPKLKSKLISARILVDHWNDWVHSLKTAILTAAIDGDELSKRQLTCLWKSFVMTIGEMQENNIRKDLFNELLAIINQLRMAHPQNDNLADISFNVLIGSLFDNDNKIRQLLKSKSEGLGPLHTLLVLITHPSFKNFYNRLSSEELVNKLKPVTILLMDESISSRNDIIVWLFNDMHGNDNTLMLWAALAESIWESNHDISIHNLWTVILWPLRFLQMYSYERSSLAWNNWLTLYYFVHSSLNKTTIDDEIYKILSSKHAFIHLRKSIEFALCATLAILKRKLLQDACQESRELNKLAELLKNIMTAINDYQCIEKIFPMLIDTLTLMAGRVIKSLDMQLAVLNISIIKIALKLITQTCKQNYNANAALMLTKNLLKVLHDLFEIEAYSTMKAMLVEELIECLPITDNKSSLQCNILLILKSFLVNNNEHPLFEKTKAAVDALDNSSLENNNDEVQNALSSVTKADIIFDKLDSNDDSVQIVSSTKAEADCDATDKCNIVGNVESVQNTLSTNIISPIDASNIDHKIDNAQIISAEQSTSKNNFATPNNKGVHKKSSNKEASIVNTVMDNGEEFVVVKSNWKFNPRKLTENQKEKLKRKREDIPALYQDLSQSQDEFRLTAWKSNDSQETTTTSSKSTSKSNDVNPCVILQNLPSREVVPKIMENIFSHNVIKDTKPNEIVVSTKSNKQQQLLPVKEPKSPRLALKDRVFRNVRNLIEKSSLQQENKQKSEDLNQTVNDNVIKTPSTKIKITSNLVNSAPSIISSERPSRVIKKPKKFDDSELIIMKKRRRSQNSSPHSDLEKPAKPFEESNVQVDTNKEEDKYPSVTNENPIPIVINESQDVHCMPLGNNDSENNVLDTRTQIIQALTNIEASKIYTKEKYHDNMDVDVSTTEINNLREENEIHDNVRVEVLTTKTNNLLPNDELPASNHKDVFTPCKEEKSTPNFKNKKTNEPKSSVKKKRSRIEQQLLIDMVEGHPLLQVQSEKRITRKNVTNVSSSVRRRSLAQKLIKIQSEIKTDKKLKRKEKSPSISTESTFVSVSESQDKFSQSLEDLPMSEDIIESSQDSSITSISVKSSKHILKKVPHVKLDNINNIEQYVKSKNVTGTQNLLDEFNDIKPLNNTLSDQESREDIELPKNKTRIEDRTEVDLTENMDTEPIKPIDSKGSCSEIILISNDNSPIVINNEDSCLALDTQDIAEADTQPLDTENETTLSVQNKESNSSLIEQNEERNEKPDGEIDASLLVNSECIQVTAAVNAESSCACSPLNDEGQRKKEFLNDTIEISPIKTMSPLRENKSPSPETSSDYVVIKLTSPVQSNGEPFEKCDSPEIFTEDKSSPDKRDYSPPRVVVSVQNTSPSSSLSLKKNRPQMRSNGRAAHMLGLCAPDKLQAIMNTEKTADSDEPKKSGNANTPARRNLRILYNSVGENVEQHNSSENDDNENFLKLKRSVPTADCSPSGPILKRKLIDIVDDTTISPASKRKRVSFHDPPVSTTVAVQKYIEPGVLRSPQSTVFKRLEKQMRANMKSPKKLENVFKLETILTKAVESFTKETTVSSIDDTVSSIDQTPAVEVVKTSDLNDTDAICSDLLDCTDPLDNIAGELSSPAMKSLFIKELEGKVKTVGDLAKMTELEVNRLCIKAPKVKVAKKVLTDYASKKAKTQCELNIIAVEPNSDVLETVPEIPQTACVEVQTNVVSTKSCEIQTMSVSVTLVQTQTDTIPAKHTLVQTDESGIKSTHDIVATCLSERPDFIDQLSKQLDESSIQQIADNLSSNASIDLLMKKMSASDSMNVLHQVLEKQIALDPSNEDTGSECLSFLQAYMCQRFNSKDLILFCSRLLQKIHDKPA